MEPGTERARALHRSIMAAAHPPAKKLKLSGLLAGDCPPYVCGSCAIHGRPDCWEDIQLDQSKSVDLVTELSQVHRSPESRVFNQMLKFKGRHRYCLTICVTVRRKYNITLLPPRYFDCRSCFKALDNLKFLRGKTDELTTMLCQEG